MSRHDLIEAVLRAQYDLETAEPEERPNKQIEFDAAITAVLAGKRIARGELLSALRPRYREFKKAQLLWEARKRSV